MFAALDGAVAHLTEVSDVRLDGCDVRFEGSGSKVAVRRLMSGSKVAMFVLVGLLLAEWTVLVWHSVMTDAVDVSNAGFYAKNLILLSFFDVGGRRFSKEDIQKALLLCQLFQKL